MKKLILLSLVVLALVACGGGGGTTDTQANSCSVAAQKSWVRAHLDDVYLWYDEIVDVPGANYATPADYFYALLVRTRDRFSFTESQAVIDAFFQSGEVVGYGANFVRAPDQRLRISYSEPNSPASLQGIGRGTVIVNINGVAQELVKNPDFSNALYPAKAGDTNSFDVLDVGASTTRLVTLTATAVIGTPVLMNQVIPMPNGKKVGYMVFNDHIVSAEAPLASAMAQFATAGIDDLVLDLRYNGGGYLYIASEVGYMIGGAPVKNQVFEKMSFNAKHPELTNDPTNTMAFLDADSNHIALPSLGLKRVFVLTGPGTCSASESIINALQAFVNVITIGGSSCGKPYGMFQANNCANAYFAIEFEGKNAAGQGGYVNGFAPTCPVADDLEHQLGDVNGDVNERVLQTALGYQSTGACPAVAMTQASAARPAAQPAAELYRAPWRNNRILTRP